MLKSESPHNSKALGKMAKEQRRHTTDTAR